MKGEDRAKDPDLASDSDFTRQDIVTRPCDVAGCEKPRKARGWCGAHYRRWSLYGDPLGSAPPRVKPEPPTREEFMAEAKAALAALRIAVAANG